jgi:hypothetical protein
MRNIILYAHANVTTYTFQLGIKNLYIDLFSYCEASIINYTQKYRCSYCIFPISNINTCKYNHKCIFMYVCVCVTRLQINASFH